MTEIKYAWPDTITSTEVTNGKELEKEMEAIVGIDLKLDDVTYINGMR